MIKKTLFVLAGALLFLFTSCENFMSGSDVKDQLEKQIAYSNAKSFILIISQDTTMGSFLSSGEKECKVGYSITVQFNVKKDAYIFKGLKAVNASDTDLSMDDCVEFQVTDHDDQKGIYKVSIKLLKEATDILIVPDCTVIPNVIKEECKPEYKENGVEQDSTIAIAFNTPVNISEYFTAGISDANGQNLSEYYEKPYLSSDKQTLFIPTNKNLKLLDPNGSIETKDIIVKIELTEVSDEEGNSGKSTFQFKYRVNKTRDTIRPVINGANIYTTANTTDPLYRELSNKVYPTEWSSSGENNGDYGASHINGSVYAEIDGYDNESGVSKIVVKETLVANTAGTEVNTVFGEYPVTIKKDEETGKYCFDYILNINNDGIVKLDFFIEDFADNRSTASKTFYVLKDTAIDSGSIKFKNEFGTFNNNSVEGWNQVFTNLENQVEGNIQNVKLELFQTIKDTYFGEFYTDYKLDAFWSYDEESFKTLTKNSDGTYSFVRDVSRFVYIKLICQDAVGNKKEIIKHMPPKPVLAITRDNNGAQIPTVVGYDSFVAMAHQSSDDRLNLSKNLKFYINLTNADSSTQKVINGINMQQESDVIYKRTAEAFMNDEYYDLAQKPVGTFDVYAIAAFGDFPSPRSENFLEFTINEWHAIKQIEPNFESEDESEHQWRYLDENNQPFRNNTNPMYCADRLLYMWTDPQNVVDNRYVYSFGVAYDIKDTSGNGTTSVPTIEYDYGPINNKIKITKTPVKNTGIYKITIDDYKKPGINTDNIVYKFYYTKANLSERNIDEADPESELVTAYKIADEWESLIPEIIIPATRRDPEVYFLRIQAYDSENNKLYMPFLPSKIGFRVQTEEISDFATRLGKTVEQLNAMTDQQLCSLFKQNNISEAQLTTLTKNTQEVIAITPRTFNDLNGNPIVITCDDDLDPPVITLSDDPFYALGSYRIDVPQDDNLLIENSKSMITYYLIPCSSNNINLIPSYTLGELSSTYFRYATNLYYEGLGDITMIDPLTNHADRVLFIPTGNISEGLYTLSVVTKDSVGNTMVKTTPFVNTILGQRNFLVSRLRNSIPNEFEPSNPHHYYTTTIMSQQPTTMVTVNSQQVPSLRTVVEVIKNDNVKEGIFSKTWGSNDYGTPSGYPEFIVNNTQGSGDNIQIEIDINYPDQNFFKEYSWIRLKSYIGFADDDSSTTGKGFYYPEYIYVGPGYPNLSSRNCIEGVNGIQVFSEFPVLGHTMYSMSKLTATKDITDAANIWECKGIETGIAIIDTHPEVNDLQESPSFGAGTYEYSNLALVPEGAYYTTIFHFADGTVIMSDIKQKQ